MKTIGVVRNIAKGVQIAGFVGVVIVAPNATVALDKLAKMHHKNPKKGYPDYLKRSGYFELERKEDKFAVRLTEKGKKILEYSDFEDYEFSTNKKWDGNWYLLMFDIPETNRKTRNIIQNKLKQLGMKQLQNSVYVHFRPTDELAKIIRQTFPATSSLVISAKLQEIDGQEQLIKAFKLI
jgi:CRISPR-associated endonuclease Cas2